MLKTLDTPSWSPMYTSRMLHQTNTTHKQLSWPQGYLAAVAQHSTATATAPSPVLLARSIMTNRPRVHTLSFIIICSTIPGCFSISGLCQSTSPLTPASLGTSLLHTFSKTSPVIFFPISSSTHCALWCFNSACSPWLSAGINTSHTHHGARPLTAVAGLKSQPTQTDLLQISPLHTTKPFRQATRNACGLKQPGC